MSKISKILGSTAVALTLMAGATQASAAFITEWGYEINAGFADFGPVAPNQAVAPNDTTNNGVVGSDPNGPLGANPNPNPLINDFPTTLSWGQGVGGPSQLTVTPNISAPPSPSVFTNLGPQNGAAVTHFNRIISEDSLTLQSATILAPLTLTPLDPFGGSLGPFNIFFAISFFESPNAGPCAEGTGDPDCADIFVLQNPGALSFDLMIEEFIYTVALTASGLGPLSDEACAAAGEPSGCIGFITPENDTTVLQTAFTITSRPVPEPGTLALLGLGLLGLGIARRRKVAA